MRVVLWVTKICRVEGNSYEQKWQQETQRGANAEESEEGVNAAGTLHAASHQKKQGHAVGGGLLEESTAAHPWPPWPQLREVEPEGSLEAAARPSAGTMERAAVTQAAQASPSAVCMQTCKFWLQNPRSCWFMSTRLSLIHISEPTRPY